MSGRNCQFLFKVTFVEELNEFSELFSLAIATSQKVEDVRWRTRLLLQNARFIRFDETRKVDKGLAEKSGVSRPVSVLKGEKSHKKV